MFPLFFFLVAALVALTTMTRMVEEERQQVGTLKALGYSTAKIAWKYLLYAAMASIAGSVIGLAVGTRLFPYIIINAYNIMYDVPEILTPFHVPYALVSSVSMICLHPAGDAVRLLVRAAGGARHADAAQGPKSRQAHLFGVHHPPVEPLEVHQQSHRPEPVPLQEAVLYDGGGHCRVHGPAGDRLWRAGFRLGHCGPAIWGAEPIPAHFGPAGPQRLGGPGPASRFGGQLPHRELPGCYAAGDGYRPR